MFRGGRVGKPISGDSGESVSRAGQGGTGALCRVQSVEREVWDGSRRGRQRFGSLLEAAHTGGRFRGTFRIRKVALGTAGALGEERGWWWALGLG